MERIMNEENDWDHNVEGHAAGLLVCVSKEKIVQAINEMKTGKATGPSDVPLELIAASEEVGIQVTAKYLRVLTGFQMPV